MALETVIASGLQGGGPEKTALVLMGGGARTAYQVGVLKALAAMLNSEPRTRTHPFPFEVLVGTSAGAINVTTLAGVSEQGLPAFAALEQFWREVRSAHVYRLNDTSANAWFGGAHKYLSALALSRGVFAHGALLDSAPLAATLDRAVDRAGILRALDANVLSSVAVTASSYSSGVHWTFYQADDDSMTRPWDRPGRRADYQPIAIQHLLASSAIPLIFPAISLKIQGEDEFFGDGSMRQLSPLSPAIHLGAKKIFVVGVGQPNRIGLGQDSPKAEPPSLAGIAAHMMASVFHDTLQADVDQARRVSETFKQLAPEFAAAMGYKPLQVFSMQPSQSLDALASAHVKELPAEIRQSLGAILASGGGASLASYLLFEPGYVDALIKLGQRDAYARAGEILSFLRDPG